jgi:hypothetical protein
MNDFELPADLKSRIMKEVAARPTTTRSTEMLRAALLVGSSVALALAIFFLVGGVRVTGRPTSLIVGTAIGTAIIAGVGTWLLLGRRRSMLGRSSIALCVVALVTPLSLLFWKVAWSAQYPGALDPWPGRIGLKCLRWSLLMGIFPLVALLFARRRTDPTHPRIAGLGAGASVGLCTALFVDMWCPVAYVPHFLLGHILPIALLAIAGLWLGKALLAPRK